MSFTKRLWDKMRQAEIAKDKDIDLDYQYQEWLNQQQPIKPTTWQTQTSESKATPLVTDGTTSKQQTERK